MSNSRMNALVSLGWALTEMKKGEKWKGWGNSSRGGAVGSNMAKHSGDVAKV